MKILAIGAHPDDIEIFMFGLLALCRGRGDTVLPVIATDGARGGTGDPAVLAATRRDEARAAAALLDADPRFLDFPDGDLVPDAALVGALRALVREERPDLVVTHPPDDYHGDHRALAVAVGLAAGFAAPVIATDGLGAVGPQPAYYVDITTVIDAKDRAIACHRSQDPDRFVAMMRGQAAFRAAQCGDRGGFAEAYRFQPVAPFCDIRALLPPPPPLRPVRDRGRPDR